MRAVAELEREELPVTDHPESTLAADPAPPQADACWRCPHCETDQARGPFVGWNGIHRCLACGYVGGGGTTTDAEVAGP
jgi:rubredoxin